MHTRDDCIPEARQQVQQAQQRPSPIFRQPRQAEMNDNSTAAPLEPRKNRGTPVPPVTIKEQEPSEPNNDPGRTTTNVLSCEVTMSPEQPPTNSDVSPPPISDPSEEESIALARQLMAQEALESYAAFSSDYLRYNTEQYSPEDLEALHAALNDDDMDEEVGGETNDEQYEIMLRLGAAIGDVKNERWKMVSEQYISLLPTFHFNREAVQGLDENDSQCKCMVCQFVYEEGECLRTLPCGHCFHAECVDQWLKDKDCCAYCRQPIVQS